jgi:hypothetical protein
MSAMLMECHLLEGKLARDGKLTRRLKLAQVVWWKIHFDL